MTALYYSITGSHRVVCRWGWFYVQRRRHADQQWTPDNVRLRPWTEIGMATRKFDVAADMCGFMGAPFLGFRSGRWL